MTSLFRRVRGCESLVCNVEVLTEEDIAAFEAASDQLSASMEPTGIEE